MVNATDPGLTYGPALYPKRWVFGSMPGHGRIVGIAGHRTTRRHPFCLLHKVVTGDYVTLSVKGVIYVYRVVFTNERADPNSWTYFMHPERYDPNRKLLSAYQRKNSEYLVLAACTPPRSAEYRINVVARLVAVRFNVQFLRHLFW